MKGFAVVVFCVSVVFVEALPQFYEKQSSNPTEDAEEIEIVPYGRRPQLSSFDDDIFTPDFTRNSFNPFANDALDSFVKRMNDLMEALQKRFSIVADRIPDLPQNGTLFVFGDGPVQNKSTSTTKVIDGNVVTVNETTFSTGDNVFHLEVIKVERKGTDVEDKIPSETTENTNVPVTTEISKPEENNEIPKDKVSFAEWDSSETLTDPDLMNNEVDSETFNEFDDVSVMKPDRVIDLSNDVLVNKLVSDQAQGQGLFMMDPNAEFIDVEDIKDRRDYFKYTPEKVVRI